MALQVIEIRRRHRQHEKRISFRPVRARELKHAAMRPASYLPESRPVRARGLKHSIGGASSPAADGRCRLVFPSGH